MPEAISPQLINFTMGQIGLNLCLSFALAFLSATVYRTVYRGPNYSTSFFLTLLITPVVVTMIMMAIGSNVAMSLGLVGALSIVRFRTVIKDTADMSYLFLTIGIGLCCGANAYALAMISTVLICAIILFIHYAITSGFKPAEYILVFRQQRGTEESTELMQSLLTWQKLHGVTDLGESEGCEYTYRIRLNPSVSPETLLDRLRRISGLSHSALLSPDSQLVL